jgi:hypothetical protein
LELDSHMVCLLREPLQCRVQILYLPVLPQPGEESSRAEGIIQPIIETTYSIDFESGRALPTAPRRLDLKNVQ